MEINDLIITDRETLQEMVDEAVQKALLNNFQQFSKELRKDDLYTTDEIADKIGVSRTTLANYRKEGKIGYVQKGSVIRYTRQHYLDFIKENEITRN